MADKGNGEKAGEKSFFARTAKNTTKKAKRAQEKVKRKLGKSHETKDQAFDTFVDNFNKQQDAVQRLQKELKNYINCLKAMLNANQLFAEAVKQVYEPEWSGRKKFVDLLDSLDHSWTKLVHQIQNDVLDPLTSYQMQFPETKNRIAKRSRKVVDYDRYRHHLETLKTKGGKTGDPKKISQAEEEYNQAKNAYLQLHSDLYEELPALYDSRISFYISSFQSIFTAEGVFHREMTKMKTEMNDLLDVLAKETSDGLYSTRRPLSVVSNASSDGDSSSESKPSKLELTDENSENETSENDEVHDVVGHSNDEHTEKEKLKRNPPPRPPPVEKKDHVDETVSSRKTSDDAEKCDSNDSIDTIKDIQGLHETKFEASNEDKSTEIATETVEEDNSVNDTNKDEVDGKQEVKGEDNVQEESNAGEKDKPDETDGIRDVDKEKGTDDVNEDMNKTSIDHSSLPYLYKVEVTHPYTGEDDDELTLEKGDIIQVIPYSESDDPDDGWLLGRLESTGEKGVFPENFTKRLEK
ncbi:myc box-dependent-interacting protein 1-like [Xenia sp. Carnegie-2017]|uniref:myc box-dependent-interacting protein 1-like n=1 Tax=Xenia sp. Carnegie-2017 TaxID=2897299 RepID=UPI001F044367|nr:myc box-dependent-interacting protein 1-like [Xenia sp. Carnegie-2017]XP_046862719.1 myc box-dependent-interacting protein 1-like [Xenia sp. Carnegie-2017]